jgi:PhzF family phenazine biosynthesis protein
VQAFLVDAFTDRPFSGNPAAVCLGTTASGDTLGDGAWMQAVAADFNLAETAFLAGGDGEYDLRWFSPAVEVPLCGHATLASAHVLWEVGEKAGTLRFRTLSGVLTAERVAERIALGLPADRPPVPVDDPALATALTAALGVPADYPVLRGDRYLMVEVTGPAAVRALKPDLGALAGIETTGIAVTAPGGLDGVDFVSRFFAPRLGVDEDPVTGSAHCLLGPYWAQRLRRTTLTAAQLSARGGRLEVEVGPETVRLVGSAVTVMRGTLAAPARP